MNFLLFTYSFTVCARARLLTVQCLCTTYFWQGLDHPSPRWSPNFILHVIFVFSFKFNYGVHVQEKKKKKKKGEGEGEGERERELFCPIQVENCTPFDAHSSLLVELRIEFEHINRFENYHLLNFAA